jgi:hydroxymethylglutaryl-CoA lyase
MQTENHKDNMFYGATPKIFEFVKKNRANPTPAEDLLWSYLCKNQLNYLRFKRQHPINPYIADFYCHSVKLVIELDGSIHQLPEIIQNDLEKEDFIKTNGLKIIRFTNQEIFKNINKILNNIKELTSSPSGVGGNIRESENSPSGFGGYNKELENSPSGVRVNTRESENSPSGDGGNIREPEYSPSGVGGNNKELTNSPSGVGGNNKELTSSPSGVGGNIGELTNSPLGVGGIKLIECPRDAIQGIKHFIPTEKKIKYINLLLQSNLFDTIDFGSFVSQKAIPQMADTGEVVRGLDLNHTKTKLLAIIANERGAMEASQFEQIQYLGYPFSISESFQLRNTNATIKESMERVKAIQEITERANKQLVIYISMGFGNPYGDEWNAEIAIKWVDELQKLGINIFSISDTVGVASSESIKYLFENLIPKYPNLEFGAHFHTTPQTWQEKVEAAYNAGCRRFDGAFLGYGGCPLAADELVGNMPMEKLLTYPHAPKGKLKIKNQSIIPL